MYNIYLLTDRQDHMAIVGREKLLGDVNSGTKVTDALWHGPGTILYVEWVLGAGKVHLQKAYCAKALGLFQLLSHFHSISYE